MDSARSDDARDAAAALADVLAIDRSESLPDAVSADAASADARPVVNPSWTGQVIYLAMPDRFTNADPSNDSLGAVDCFAPTDPRRFHGGDLQGVRSRLDYLRALGATALWITPVYKQIARRPSGSCGYHGYWPDFSAPDDRAIQAVQRRIRYRPSQCDAVAHELGRKAKASSFDIGER